MVCLTSNFVIDNVFRLKLFSTTYTCSVISVFLCPSTALVSNVFGKKAKANLTGMKSF